jgi:hypothetical protein
MQLQSFTTSGVTNILVSVPSKKEKLPLSETHPSIAEELYGISPLDLTAGSHQKVTWKCNLGHLWIAEVADRTRGQGCAVCAGRQIQIGVNDLATTHPNLAAQADGWDPREVTAGSRKQLSWICLNGHSWSARVDSRSGNTRGCPICSGHKTLIGYNDLQTTHPQLANQATDWDPTSLTAGSARIVKWTCPAGHSWNSKVSNRANLGRNCPTCAKKGFDPSLDGYLYFLEHHDKEMHQIGITNFPDQRLAQHKKKGWVTLEIRGPMDGHLAQQWETAILRMLKSNGADLSNSKIAGRFDGYSEAWSKSTFIVNSIQELMLLTDAFEQK